jgi:hypothetical protein
MNEHDIAGLIFAALFGWALLRPLFMATTTCPGHGSDLIAGTCPDCTIEADDWATTTRSTT